MGFKDSASRKAYFAGMAAAKKQAGFTSNPSLKLPKLKEPQLKDTAPELPKLPKFPKIKSLMKIKK
jgi:hypothetical protein